MKVNSNKVKKKLDQIEDQLNKDEILEIIDVLVVRHGCMVKTLDYIVSLEHQTNCAELPSSKMCINHPLEDNIWI